MDARTIITKIRDHHVPSDEELKWFATGLATGKVSDAQAGAFAMAVLLNDIGDAGRVALTQGMRDSGDVLSWDLPGPVVDKHSTGGIGDCVSLILAPALAACGVYVPMISGRGLGHTGGTLDKMESIPGVSAQIDERKLRAITAKIGCAIVGATQRIAPADRRLYAIRDVTGTIESIDLITASILSKKLAAGLGGLILDVKTGSGAFMKTAERAKALADTLVATANGAGCPTVAMITDMNQPLAPTLGNALEVATCMHVLAGEIDAAPRLHELALDLGAKLLTLTGKDEAEARGALDDAISSGKAMEKFAAMVAALGGPPDMADDWHTHLPKAPVIGDVVARESGVLTSMNGEALGLIVVDLGGGRRVETDRIDPAVGLSNVAPLGTKLSKGDVICTIHARDEDSAEAAAKAALGAITLGGSFKEEPLVHEVIEP